MPWGRRIEAGKRYNEIDAVKRYVMDVRNMLLRTGFPNDEDASKRIGMAAGRRFNMNRFRQGNYMRYNRGQQ